jgi:integrase
VSIYKRKSGRWAVLIDVERKSSGKRVRRAIGTFNTRKDAERAERQALEARDRGINLAPAKLTVEQLMTRFIEHCRADDRTPATIETYEQKSKLYIVPSLGGVLLLKLRPTHIAEWIAALRTSGGENKKPLSAKTVRNVYGLLHGALSWALDLELVGRNVCDTEAARPPKPSRSPAKALDDGEVARLLITANATRWGPFITLALATGARRGELCALSWNDVDFEARTVTIARSLSQTKDRVELKGTKTGSVRRLSLSRLAFDALQRQHAAQAHDKLRARGKYLDEGAVFATPRGGRITPMSATKAFVRLAKEAHISTTRLHDTRHTAATHLLVSGTDVRTTAGVLGHATANVTLSIYAHLVGDAQRAAIDGLGARLERISASSATAAAQGGQPVDRTDFATEGNRMATVTPLPTKNARKIRRSLVEARRLELLTLTLPA